MQYKMRLKTLIKTIRQHSAKTDFYFNSFRWKRFVENCGERKRGGFIVV